MEIPLKNEPLGSLEQSGVSEFWVEEFPEARAVVEISNTAERRGMRKT